MRAILFLLPVLLASAACAVEADDGDVGEELAQTSDALSGSCSMSRAAILAATSAARQAVIKRGFAWFDAKVPYSQSKSYKGYRTDCSGFVSMAWELGTSYTTANFSSGGGKSGPLGSFDKLAPGDALVRRSNGSGHIVLFLGWNDTAKKGACVVEQASTASDMQFRVRTTASLRSGGYKAIRADKLASDQGAPGAGAADDDEATAGDDDAANANDGDTGQETTGGGTNDGATGIACASDGTCNPGNNGSGMICSSGQCVPGCRADYHCPGVEICVSGQCR